MIIQLENCVSTIEQLNFFLQNLMIMHEDVEEFDFNLSKVGICNFNISSLNKKLIIVFLLKKNF